MGFVVAQMYAEQGSKSGKVFPERAVQLGCCGVKVFVLAHFLLLASRHACLTSNDISGENSAIAQSIFLTSIIDGYIQKQMANSHRTPMTITAVITSSFIKANAASISTYFLSAWFEGGNPPVLF